MSEHSGHVQLITLRSRHNTAVTSIGFCAANKAVISSAEDDRTSVIIQQLNSKWKDYIFAVPKGVRVVDYSWRRQLLVTGGEDRQLRLWNPVVPARPVATLTGHYSRLVDVAVHEFQSVVISLDMDAVVNIWDAEEHLLLQSVLLESPPSRSVLQPEFGSRVIVSSTPKFRSVLILFSDIVNQLFVRRPSRQGAADDLAAGRRLAALRQERAGSPAMASPGGLRSRRQSRRSSLAVQQHPAASVAEAATATVRNKAATRRLRHPPPDEPAASPTADEPTPAAETTPSIEDYLRVVSEAEPTFFEVNVPEIPRPARNNLVTNRLMGRQSDTTEAVRLVRACTPFKALRLHPLSGLPAPGGLPVSSRMRRLGLRCGTLEEVMEMTLPSVPAGRGVDSKPSSLASSVLSLQRQKQRRRDLSRASLSDISQGSPGSAHSS